ncbi:MAG: hypothetical protein J0H37_05250 [Hyphomicrobium denitrificans]|jgi:hypothetical protein|nr:hypothetical protein [Hyphomicrobium denitrificans]
MTAFFSPAAVTAAAAFALMSFAGLGDAQAAPGAGAAAMRTVSPTANSVHDVGYRSRRYHRRYYRGRVVDAPFAHVESGRRTVVDAPFVHVYKGRRGTRVVAPFVDLWNPR